MNYVNLHTHSIYSIRDSIAKIDDLVGEAKKLDYKALGLSDHGTLGGAIQFYNACKKQEIKPILGVEAYIATRTRFDKVKGIDKYFHITLFAMNMTGWQNLCQLVTESNKDEHFYHKPRIDRELLRRHNEGLICLSGCMASQVSRLIIKELQLTSKDEEGNNKTLNIECADCQSGICTEHSSETFMDVIRWYKGVFGDRYYLEIMNHDIPEEEVIRDVLLEVGKKEGIKTIASGDTHFVKENDHTAHDIMLAIRDRKSIHDLDFKGYQGDGYYLPTESSLLKKFSFSLESITNTLEVAERCDLNFKFGNFRIPSFDKNNVRGEDEDFMTKAWAGLKARVGAKADTALYKKRLQEEMTTIIQMTFSSYFLIVSDYVTWAKTHDILVGPGRGSAAGSLVAYALNITDVDPLLYDLSFARFLNRGRSAVPLINFPEFPITEWKPKTK